MDEREILERAASFVKRADELFHSKVKTADRVRSAQLLRAEMTDESKNLAKWLKRSQIERPHALYQAQEFYTDSLVNTIGKTSQSNFEEFLYNVMDYARYHLN